MQGPLGPVQADHAAHPDGGAGGDEAKRAFDAMMIMKKIDVAETREVYEQSPWLEEQIYRGFPGARDTALMREFHRASWPGRAEIAEQFEDDRYRKIARRIVFNHRPDLLGNETCKSFSEAIARRWLTEGKARWLTIGKALADIEERREGSSYDEALVLEGMEVYFRDREAWAKSRLEE